MLSNISLRYMTPKQPRQTRHTLGLTKETRSTTPQDAPDHHSVWKRGFEHSSGGRDGRGPTQFLTDFTGRIVAAGEPIEPIPQTERVEVPKSMLGRGETFALRVKGSSMRDEGILSGDVVVVQKQGTARNGQTVIALVNGEATIKTY
jgi:hypothetical protein